MATDATPQEVAKYLTLCGPSVEKLEKKGNDYIYSIEITTNRVDAASVLGIAREAVAILPQFGKAAKLKAINRNLKTDKPASSLPLKLISNPKLVNRLTGVVIEDIKDWKSPTWMQKCLVAAGMRSLNSVIDITNFVMLTVGHPCHVFDYDKIKNHTIIVRESKKGEKITSFDNKNYTLPGGDIVFEDVDGEIIDLPGIIGTKNSVVSKDTKRVLLFFDNNDPVKIRRTSMTLGIRTMAAILNEKRVDPELIPLALSLGIDLFERICKGRLASKIYDVYPFAYKTKWVYTSKEFLENILGVALDKNKITKLLKALGFLPIWSGNSLKVGIPSFRQHDVSIPEDIAEEVARIYGYHNLPSELMDGKLPQPAANDEFKFEEDIRQTLKGFGATEIMTYSLVSKEMAGSNALKLANPLGVDTEYLRTSLKPSLLSAVAQNAGIRAPYHLFEIANVYIPPAKPRVVRNLPEERMTLAGIFVNQTYRQAKGVLEALFESLNIASAINLEEINGTFYYEFEVNKLRCSVKTKTYIPVPKYPPQIEDITIEIPEGKPVGEVIQSIKQASKMVHSIELVDIYERKFTFRISYLHPNKTLSDKEVEEERNKITNALPYALL